MRRQEGEAEAEEVVILDHVGIAPPDEGAEVGDQRRLDALIRCLEDRLQAAAIPHRDLEDPLSWPFRPSGVFLWRSRHHSARIQPRMA